MNRIIELLAASYEYDVNWLATPWVLWTVIPAMLYVAFMVVKWTVLTCPVWIPLSIIVSGLLKGRK